MSVPPSTVKVRPREMRVERAMQAYRTCRERLDPVKETLGKYLQEHGAPAGDGRPEPGVEGAVRTSPRWSPGQDGERDGLVF